MKSYEEIAGLKARLEKENVYLQEEIRTVHNFEEIVGNSTVLLELLRRVDQVAPTDSSVLIYGETGTDRRWKTCRLSFARYWCSENWRAYPTNKLRMWPIFLWGL